MNSQTFKKACTKNKRSPFLLMSWLNKPKFRKKVCANFLVLDFIREGTTAGVTKDTDGSAFKEPLQSWFLAQFYTLLINSSYLVSSNNFFIEVLCLLKEIWHKITYKTNTRYKACSIKSHTLTSWYLGGIVNDVNIAIEANEQDALYFSQRQNWSH